MKKPALTPEVRAALQALGSIGGKERAKRLSKEQLHEIAMAGVRARQAKARHKRIITRKLRKRTSRQKS